MDAERAHRRCVAVAGVPRASPLRTRALDTPVRLCLQIDDK
jgi:hypothetical protein